MYKIILQNTHYMPVTFSFFYSHIHSIWKFLGQDLNTNHLCWSCSNPRSFNPLHWAREWTCTSNETWATAFGFLTQCTTALIPASYLLFLKIYIIPFCPLKTKTSLYSCYTNKMFGAWIVQQLVNSKFRIRIYFPQKFTLLKTTLHSF